MTKRPNLPSKILSNILLNTSISPTHMHPHSLDIVYSDLFFSPQLLRKENLDLKLTPYKVLATSTKHGQCEHTCSYWGSKEPNTHSRILTPAVFVYSGFMQFVQSVPVAEVLATEGNIQVGQSDTPWLIQCCLLLDSGSFSCFGSTAHWISNETRSMRFYLLNTKLMLKFPPKPSGTENECISRENIAMIVIKYLYWNSVVLHSLPMYLTSWTIACWDPHIISEPNGLS